MILKHISRKTTCINCILPILFMGMLITSCTTPTQPSADITTISIRNVDTLESLSKEAKVAEQLTSPKREEQLIDIARRLTTIDEWFQAENIINIIESKTLEDQNYIHYTIVAGNIYLKSQTLLKAKQLLSSDKLNSLTDQLTIEQQKQLHKIKAILLAQIGETTASLNERIALGTLLFDTTEINENNNALWQQLSNISHEEQVVLSDTQNSVLQGWLELSSISKQSQGSLAKHKANILAWIAENPNHPASQELPSDLALLKNLTQEQPQHIALLLPLQGKLANAGQAIRDGFLAAYYQRQVNLHEAPTIRLFDTSGEDFNTLYDRVSTSGVDMIIGPLEKESVKQLQQRATLAIPTLALNYSEDAPITEPTKTLYQFGLSLEDEARQVAERAWLEGHRQALIISTSENWSQRAAEAFTTQWQQYGGIIIENDRLDNSESYSQNIESILKIDQSTQRATELKRLFGRGFEFEPRRRADIDMIFLATRAQEGLQIKPTLNFHYASNIPVYSTSQIYSSTNSRDKNSDLNNIRFTTLPWILNNDTPEKQLITNNMTISPGYERLYALGVDSFLLYPQLQQLYQLSNQKLYGTTGLLSVDQHKRVIRQQLWAKISKGELEALKTLTLLSDESL
jgi:uncharacterized protein